MEDIIKDNYIAEDDVFSLRIIKCLRIYIKRKTTKESRKSAKIDFLDVLPKVLKKNGLFAPNKLEKLDTMLENLNENLQQYPLPGRILNMEVIGTNCQEELIDDEK